MKAMLLLLCALFGYPLHIQASEYEESPYQSESEEDEDSGFSLNKQRQIQQELNESNRRNQERAVQFQALRLHTLTSDQSTALPTDKQARKARADLVKKQSNEWNALMSKQSKQFEAAKQQRSQRSMQLNEYQLHDLRNVRQRHLEQDREQHKAEDAGEQPMTAEKSNAIETKREREVQSLARSHVQEKIDFQQNENENFENLKKELGIESDALRAQHLKELAEFEAAHPKVLKPAKQQALFTQQTSSVSVPRLQLPIEQLNRVVVSRDEQVNDENVEREQQLQEAKEEISRLQQEKQAKVETVKELNARRRLKQQATKKATFTLPVQESQAQKQLVQTQRTPRRLENLVEATKPVAVDREGMLLQQEQPLLQSQQLQKQLAPEQRAKVLEKITQEVKPVVESSDAVDNRYEQQLLQMRQQHQETMKGLQELQRMRLLKGDIENRYADVRGSIQDRVQKYFDKFKSLPRDVQNALFHHEKIANIENLRQAKDMIESRIKAEKTLSRFSGNRSQHFIDDLMSLKNSMNAHIQNQ